MKETIFFGLILVVLLSGCYSVITSHPAQPRADMNCSTNTECQALVQLREDMNCSSGAECIALCEECMAGGNCEIESCINFTLGVIPETGSTDEGIEINLPETDEPETDEPGTDENLPLMIMPETDEEIGLLCEECLIIGNDLGKRCIVGECDCEDCLASGDCTIDGCHLPPSD